MLSLITVALISLAPQTYIIELPKQEPVVRKVWVLEPVLKEVEEEDVASEERFQILQPAYTPLIPIPMSKAPKFRFKYSEQGGFRLRFRN